MKQPRPSRKQFMKRVQVDIAKLEQDAAVPRMMAEALCWHFELSSDRIGEIVRDYLAWIEAGGKPVERVHEQDLPAINGVVCPPLV